ncbi:DUF2971 domain-containing protein [Phascolarctobacterium faecium]|mgnify:FL=1|uniref:DUF2971 domain-containing protein n=1 Tax=Phascolarctobacterium faecium TaxID=33025 RepID=UPI003A9316E8
MIYRFRSCRSINEYKELLNREVYFSDLQSLNDPMEGVNNIYWNGDKIVWVKFFRVFAEYYLNNTNKNIKQEIKENIKSSFINDIDLKVLIDNIINVKVNQVGLKNILFYVCFILERQDNNVFNNEEFHIASRDKLVSLLVNAIKRDGMKEYLDNLNPEREISNLIPIGSSDFYNRIDKFIEEIISNVSRKFYVACFTTEYSNSSMWGIYADSHRGVCLMFEDNTMNCYEEEMEYKKIDYKNVIEQFNFFELLVMLKKEDFFSWTSFLDMKSKYYLNELEYFEKQRMFQEKLLDQNLRKLTDWSFEKEYRLILNGFLEPKYNTAENRKIKYNLKSLRGVIFGINTSLQDKKEIFYMILNICQKEKSDHIKLYQAVYSYDNNEIKTIELDGLNKFLKTLI